MSKLFINTDMVATLKGLKDIDGVAVTTASVNLTVLIGGVEVGGQTWPTTMTSVGGGDYRAALSKDLQVNNHETLTVKIVATDTGKQAEFIQKVAVTPNEFD